MSTTKHCGNQNSRAFLSSRRRLGLGTLVLFPRLYIRKTRQLTPPRSRACALVEAQTRRQANARLLELLLDAELVRVTALLLAAVGRLGVKAGIAPAVITRVSHLDRVAEQVAEGLGLICARVSVCVCTPETRPCRQGKSAAERKIAARPERTRHAPSSAVIFSLAQLRETASATQPSLPAAKLLGQARACLCRFPGLCYARPPREKQQATIWPGRLAGNS